MSDESHCEQGQCGGVFGGGKTGVWHEVLTMCVCMRGAGLTSS